jgi:hypothetical protein
MSRFSPKELALIEETFKPHTFIELLVRLDLEGMQEKAGDWITNNAPDAMPHRFRSPYYHTMLVAFEREEIYRKLKAL